MNKLLIGVTSYNRLPYTKLCLEALENLEGISFDCIILDNNSQPEVKEYLKQYDGKVLPNSSTFRVLFLDKNYGVGKALNKALVYRHPDQHFMKLDNDTLFPSKAVPGHIDEKNVNKKCLAQMVDAIENSIEPIGSMGALLFDRNRPTKAPRYVIKTATGNEYITENFSDSHINGACQLYPNRVMNQLGKFQENFVYGYEDSEMGNRALKYGLALAAEWVYIAHIDQLNLPESNEILDIKKKSLSGQLKVPE